MRLLATFVGAKMGILEARIAKIQAGIEAKKAYAEEKATNYVKKICANLLADAATASPQWSGDYASNWNIYVDAFPAYSGGFKVTPWQALRGEEKKRGDPEAIDFTVRKGMQSIDKLRWNMQIRLANFSLVSGALDAEEVNLRPVNKLSPEMSVVSYLKMNYRCMP